MSKTRCNKCYEVFEAEEFVDCPTCYPTQGTLRPVKETESGRETITGAHLYRESDGVFDDRRVYFRSNGTLYPIKTITVEKPNNLSQKSYLVLDDGTYVQTEKEDLSSVLKPGDTLDLGVDSLFVCELVNVCKSIFFTTSGAFMCQVRLPDGQMTIMQLTQEQIERYKRC